MLKAALVGAGTVFLANMIAESDFVKKKLAENPGSAIWKHGNVLAGAVVLAAAHKLHVF